MGKYARLAIITLIIGGLLATSCTSSSDDNSQDSIDSITKPYEFSVPQWEFDTVIDGLWESLKPATKADIDDIETVNEYFDAISPQSNVGDSQKAELEDETERILAKQIRQALINEGIMNPLDTFLPLKIVLPPVNFEFESPPSLLILSPRDEIRLLRRTTLEADLSTQQKEEIEAQADKLGYSSLVVNLGGVGFTYPTMVIESTNIRRTIDRAVEEWFHQYMFFHPLGFLYALDAIGWRSGYDIITMNETVAGIVSKEIGAKVYYKYYASESEYPTPPDEPVSEFALEMRQIRLAVDEYLAVGQVTEAEEFMRQKQDFLASKGYYIRKLNQAYFAFYGTYADDPSTASPIGQDLQTLRDESSSLREFLNEVKSMTSYEDLKEAAEETRK
ncbi:MAG: hypothetical protein HOC20_07910 [Chloroflexi bacterium]|jgi:hypothetical protein|nr:hypothetical protein [Chloroflexota bacterium]